MQMAANSYYQRRLQASRRQRSMLSPRFLANILFFLLVLFFMVVPAAVFVSRAASSAALLRKSPSAALRTSVTSDLAIAAERASGLGSGLTSTSVQFSEPRSVARKLKSVEQAEGVGARVRRSIGRPEVKQLDPFLLLDYVTLSPPAGFPDHPHRGFETVTYVLEGAVSHEDFAGHKGTIRAGDLQWMTAGRGIVHSEMPATNGVQRALQLWVNLPAKEKMIEPGYQELESKDIREAEMDGVKVRVIAGESLGVKSQVYTRTPTLYLDFTLQPGSVVHQPTPSGWNAFAYTLEGQTTFGAEDATTVNAHHTVLLSFGDGLVASNKSDKPARFLLIGGQPLNEPVAQFGPFVMNNQDQIMEAFQDYRNFRNGFERAKSWVSDSSTGAQMTSK